jgi:hypothetical protein
VGASRADRLRRYYASLVTLEPFCSSKRPKLCKILVELDQIVGDVLDVFIADGSLAHSFLVGWTTDSLKVVVMVITSVGSPLPAFQAPCLARPISAALGYFR